MAKKKDNNKEKEIKEKEVKVEKKEEAKEEIVEEEEQEVKEKKVTKKVKTGEKESAMHNKCPACSAPIFFQPSLNKWKCEYCNSEFSLEEMQKYNNASSEANNESVEEEITNEELELTSYKCQNCGAEIVADQNTAATFCVYCGSVAILKSKLSGKFSPDSIIPFKKEKEEAIKAFESLSKGRPLCPKDFTNKKNIEKIKGVYIPFWLHNMTIKGSLNSNATKVTSWTSGDYHYTKTDIYKLFRTGEVSFIRVPVDGSTNFDNDIMNSIEPFNYDELIKYNHAFLSGFFAEKYDVPSEDTISEASNRALKSTEDIMYEDAKGYTTRTVCENTLAATENNTEYAMLPVYMVNVRYGDKSYIFAMNGETGKFIGNIPLDKGKAWLYGILIFLGSFVVIYFILLYFMG